LPSSVCRCHDGIAGSLSDRIAKELRRRGYSSLAAFIRIAVQNELDGRDAEERLTSTTERFSRELSNISATLRSWQAACDQRLFSSSFHRSSGIGAIWND